MTLIRKEKVTVTFEAPEIGLKVKPEEDGNIRVLATRDLGGGYLHLDQAVLTPEQQDALADWIDDHRDGRGA